MFDRKSYCEACGRLTLDAGKIEEMIIMTENQEKKAHRFPKRAALVAAALAAALCVTAAAVEVPAVQEFFATVFVTITTNDNVAAGITLPSVAVEEREGRSILVVNGEETDITDALAQDGGYLYEGDGFQVQVDEHGVAIITSYGADGTVVTYSTKTSEGQDVVYNVTATGADGEPFTVTAADTPGDVSWGVYNIVTDPSGAMEVQSAGK